MNRLLPAAVMGAAAIAAGALFLNRAPGLTDLVPAASAQEAAPSGLSTAEMAIGEESAPLTIYEYASYTCPHCADFHENVFPQMKADYIDTGKVRFVYREVYFDRPALWASLVARCGGEAKFFGITDMIFEQQGDWAREQTGEGIADKLRKIGLMAGIDNDQLNACLTDADTAQALVARFEEQAAEDNITGTPSFVIDGETVPNQSYENLKSIIDAALEG